MAYLYVAHLREFRRLDEPVWKIGFTQRTVQKRLHGYPKGTAICMASSVADGRAAETKLKQILSKLPGIKRRFDLGLEYYECALAVIAKAFGMAIEKCLATVPLASDTEDDDEEEFEVEDILEHRVRRYGKGVQDTREEYKVLWKGCPKSKATWEPKHHLANAPKVLQAYLKRVQASAGKRRCTRSSCIVAPLV